MSRRNQMIVLALLVAMLGVMTYFRLRPADDIAKTTSAAGLFAPIPVDNPALRLDILQRFLNLQYKGAHRNIFVATLPPPPPLPQPVAPVNVGPVVPPPPPPFYVGGKDFGVFC